MTHRVLLPALLVTLLFLSTGGSLLPAATGPVDRAAAVEASQTEFTAQVRSYDGEVAVEDAPVVVRGDAPGVKEIVVVLVDKRADTVAATGRVGANGTFSIEVPIRDADGALATGAITATAFSPGPDGYFGTAGIGPDSPAEFAAFARNLQPRGITDREAVDRLYEQTVGGPGSDDAAVDVSFELAGSKLSITAVESATVGGSLRISGVTNRRPATGAIELAVTGGPTPDVFPTVAVATWGPDGRWTGAVPVPPTAEPGTYTLRASVGSSSDTAQITVSPATPTVTTTTTTTPRVTTATPGQTTRSPAATTTRSPPVDTPAGGFDLGEFLPVLGVAVGALAVLGVGVAVVVVTIRRRRRHPPRL